METITANGLEFAYISYGEGPLVLCLHGFPDSAHTWDELAPRIAELGYRVVTPFMRGYEPTAIPQNDSYGALDLGADALALIQALGYETAVLIGHDWGALATYTAANMNPQAVNKLITLAIPHPRALTPSIVGLWRARHFITYQFKGHARRSLTRQNMGGVDDIYRRWSPTWRFPAEETAYIKESFRQEERLDAALGYYWSFQAQATVNRSMLGRRTDVPTRCIVGSVDGALSFSIMEKTPQCFTGDYDYRVLPNIGHFPHREAPDLVFDYISSFLTNES